MLSVVSEHRSSERTDPYLDDSDTGITAASH